MNCMRMILVAACAEAARAFDTMARKVRGVDAHGGKDPKQGHVFQLNFPSKAELAHAAKLKRQRRHAKAKAALDHRSATV